MASDNTTASVDFEKALADYRRNEHGAYQPCQHCGYCPSCGRSNLLYHYAWPYYLQPFWPYQPYNPFPGMVWCGTTNNTYDNHP